jgi:hypothetical protein
VEGKRADPIVGDAGRTEDMKHKPLPYFSNCVSWPKHLVDAPSGLCDMISDGVDITRRTFLAHVDRQALAEIEADLGYQTPGPGRLTMAGDCHVAYRKGTVLGRPAYFFVHSAIEFVFADIQDELQQAA